MTYEKHIKSICNTKILLDFYTCKSIIEDIAREQYVSPNIVAEIICEVLTARQKSSTAQERLFIGEFERSVQNSHENFQQHIQSLCTLKLSIDFARCESIVRNIAASRKQSVLDVVVLIYNCFVLVATDPTANDVMRQFEEMFYSDIVESVTYAL